MIVWARRPVIPSDAISPVFAVAIREAVGKIYFKDETGTAMGVPNLAANLPANVDAPATEICCPRTARTAISNPSKLPGTRNPGRALARTPSAALMAAGSACRSKSRLTRSRIAPQMGTRPSERRTQTTFFRRLSCRKNFQKPVNDWFCRVRRTES